MLSSSTYDGYGMQAGNDTSGDPYGGFGGQFGYYKDVETGLSLLGMRYYDPGTGRFVSRDPLEYEAGANLYRYCHNNPLSGIDPMGLDDGYWDEVGQVFVGYGHAIGNAVNPVGMYNGAVALYSIGHECGAGVAAKTFGLGMWHSFTDWTTTDDPTKFGESFGNVLITAATIAAPKATCLGAFRNCFAGNTPVQMADGSHKPIAQVQPGDVVMSRDPQTGRTEAKRVLSTSKRWAGTLLTLHLADSSGKVVQELTCTPEHRFAVAGKSSSSAQPKFAGFTVADYTSLVGSHSVLTVTPSVSSAPAQFVAAGKLAIGTSIQTRAGPCLTLQSVSRQTRRSGFTVYNFVVADDHTYFVGTAEDGVWTHNAYIPQVDPWEIRFPQNSIKGTFTDGELKGTSLDDAIASARETGSLPEGITINVTPLETPFGTDYVTLNNRSLYVAQEADLATVPVNDLGPSGWNTVQKQLNNSGLEGPLPAGVQPVVRD